MTAEVFGLRAVHKDPDEKLVGGFSDRVSSVEGTRPPSGLKRPVGDPPAGSIHRQSDISGYQHPTLDHKPYSSVHRPEEPTDLQKLKQTFAQRLLLRISLGRVFNGALD